MAIERAIALGKAGQFEEDLAQLNPYLEAPSAAEAKACYVAGFLFKERFKKDNMPGSLSGDRTEAVRWLRQALESGCSATSAPWRTRPRRPMGYLGGTFFDDVVQGVDAFEPGQEARILELFEAHEEVALYLDANLDATAERTEVHKNMARAYRQWFEATRDEAHFEGIVSQYQQALALSPRDMTATYNLAVNIYNRGVDQINAMDETPRLPRFWPSTNRAGLCSSAPCHGLSKQMCSSRVGLRPCRDL